VIEARFIGLEQAEQESLSKPYCPDSLAALQRYKATL
ncbi:MAG: NUDIX hydrolase, partial [Pseudomonas sp.]|nr:NUDIX hydrolase [Pseudomonas sp.]